VKPLSWYLVDGRVGKPLADAPWQVVGFRDADRDFALKARDFMTLVPRDTMAPLRLTIDAGNPYAGPDQGIGADPKRLPATGTAVTLALKRRADGPAPRAPTPAAIPAAPESK